MLSMATAPEGFLLFDGMAMGGTALFLFVSTLLVIQLVADGSRVTYINAGVRLTFIGYISIGMTALVYVMLSMLLNVLRSVGIEVLYVEAVPWIAASFALFYALTFVGGFVWAHLSPSPSVVNPPVYAGNMNG